MTAHLVSRPLVVATVARVASGCIYANVRSPRAFRSATPGDVKAALADRVASGEACYQSVLYAISWGDASHAAAAERALGGDTGAILYDVKADTRVTSILLGAYTPRVHRADGSGDAPVRPRLLPVAVAVAAGLAGVSGPVRAQEAYEANPGLLAPEGYVIFLNVAGPLSYATLTPRDLPPGAVTLGPVKGRACQLGVAVPVSGSVSATRISGGGGEGGFDRAVRDIQARHPDVHGIYDVKVDEHVFRILTFFPRLCMEITALGFR